MVIDQGDYGHRVNIGTWAEGHEWRTKEVNLQGSEYFKPMGGLAAVTRVPGSKAEIFYNSRRDKTNHIRSFSYNDKDGKFQYEQQQVGIYPADNTGISAVSRAPNTMEVFYVDGSNTVYHAYWYDSDQKWHSEKLPCPVPTDAMPQSLTAVSSDPNSLDVFWVTSDGRLRHMHWGGEWTYEELFGRGIASPYTRIASISRKAGTINLFWFREDGQILQAYWKDDQNWKLSDKQIAELGGSIGGITVASRKENHMEVFWTHQDGTIYHAYWFEGQNWIETSLPNAPQGACTGGSVISAVSRRPDTLEGFCLKLAENGKEGVVKHFIYYE